jgi:hypothetical protein
MATNGQMGVKRYAVSVGTCGYIPECRFLGGWLNASDKAGVDRGVGGVDWQLAGHCALLAVVLRIFSYLDQANAQAAMRQWTGHL